MEPTPLLLIPGPVPMHPRVMEELAKPAAPHYGDLWVKRYAEVIDMLRRLFKARDGEIYPFAGPTHGAMDTICFTLLRRGDRVAIVDNGFFGLRFTEMLKAHHLEVDVIPADWGAPPDLQEVERVVRKGAKCLFVVHNETSTGMVNPVRELATIATDHGAWMFVDAVSSLGGIPLDCDAWKIEACFTGSQKCLAAAPGVAPIMVAKRLMEEADPKTADGWYVNLFSWNKIRAEWGDWHPQPTTMFPGVFYGFYRALQLVEEEGLEARCRRHATIGKAYREGLRGLGFTMFAKEEYASDTVTSTKPPKGLEPAKLLARLKAEDGILAAGTLGPMRGQGIRLGHLGMQASVDFVEPVLTALAKHAKEAGVKGTKDAVDRAVQIARKAGKGPA